MGYIGMNAQTEGHAHACKQKEKQFKFQKALRMSDTNWETLTALLTDIYLYFFLQDICEVILKHIYKSMLA